VDVGFEQVEATEVLRGALRRLPARERRIVGLRYYHELSQCEIAGELGISQMHVSRLLSRSLGVMRETLQPAC
jgi:RNA polymerase sigma-B factor